MMKGSLLQGAMAALKSGRRSEGRRLLEEAVQADPHSEQGWLWLSEAVDTDEERRFCVTQVLSINSRNALARRGMEALGPGPVQSPLWLPIAEAITARHKVAPCRSDRGAVQTDRYLEGGRSWSAEGQGSLLTAVLFKGQSKTLTWRESEAPGRTAFPSPGDEQERLPRPQADHRLGTIGHPHGGWESAIGSPLLPIALGYLVALAVAEELTTLTDARVGLAVYGMLLAGLILHTALTWRRPFYKLFLSLTVVPLIRLLSLSLPLASLPLVYWYLIVSIPLFVAAFLIAHTVGFSWRQIGFNLKGLPVQGLVGLTGLILGYIEYQLLRPEPLTQAFTWDQLWLPTLILLVCTGFAEELLFRGVMQRAATEAMGSLGGLYVAALFAVLHVGHRAWLDIPFVFGVALFFSWVVAKTQSLLGVTLAHGLTNITLFLVFPLLPAVGGG
jgi:membrane protease YdiL (CAAX protease family)